MCVRLRAWLWNMSLPSGSKIDYHMVLFSEACIFESLVCTCMSSE